MTIMTETQFTQVKNLVWSKITTLINNLGHPPTDDEFQNFYATVKQILPILHPNIKVSADDYEKILLAVLGKVTVQM